MKFQGFAAAVAATFTLLSTTSAFAVTEISWWHAMTGANNEVVEALSKEFNESQTDYKVVPVFKGTYPETLNAGIAAFRAKQPPAHPAGVRRRHRRDDGRRRRHQAGRRDPVDGRHRLRQEPVPAGHRLLLFEAGRHHAVLPLQFLLADPLLQQGHFPEGRARRRQSAEDLAGSLGRRQEDQGQRRGALRLHLDLAHLDPHREFRRLEQSAVRHATRTASPAPTSS